MARPGPSHALLPLYNGAFQATMPLSSGATLGPYTVVAKIGEGGMGEVYQARDTKLDRDVALKVLPEAFTSDPDRLARFEREAKVLASLNHPNIGSIYGLEEAEGGKFRALVLELIEGPTLADLIAQGPIPVDEALRIAKQIAEALEAAHEAGVIHRDFKPANIKVREDGTVKVLDFGLAKALEPTSASAAADPSQSPTLTAAATQMGVILGTAAYMSPEQARGKPVDKRTDIWAFGAVLFEMLTGTKPFPGDDVSQTLARVIDRDPDWDALPSTLPSALTTYLHRCLQKDLRQRVRDIGDVRLAMEGAFEAQTPVPNEPGPISRRERHVWGIAVALLIAALAVMVFRAIGDEKRPEVVRLSIIPAKETFDGGFALSPDGRRLAYGATDEAGVRRVWIRALDAANGEPLTGTEGGEYPFWSPDSQSVGFFAAGSVKKIAATGGAVQSLSEGPSRPRGGSWNADDDILFAGWSGPIRRVSANGGQSSVVRDLDVTRGEAALWWPAFLPDGDHFLFGMRTTSDGAGLYVGSVSDPSLIRNLLATADFPQVQYAEPGFLIYRNADELLMAQLFDTRGLALSGDGVPITQSSVGCPVAWCAFSVSPGGVLAYQLKAQSAGVRARQEARIPGRMSTPRCCAQEDTVGPDILTVCSPPSRRVATLRPRYAGLTALTASPRTLTNTAPNRRLIPRCCGRRSVHNSAIRSDRRHAGNENRLLWFDRQGAEDGSVGEPDEFWTLRLSPDESRVAANPSGAGRDIWLYDRLTGLRDRFTFDPENDGAPVWSPDGEQLAFFTYRSGPQALFVKPVDDPGEAELLVAAPGVTMYPTDWSDDGQSLAFDRNDGQSLDVWVYSFEQEDAFPVVSSGFNEREGQFSPNGRWLAYTSDQTGEDEVYIGSFSGPVLGQRVSDNGGTHPRWRGDGAELFYVAPGGRVMSVDLSIDEEALDPSPPRELFQTRMWLLGGPNPPYDVTSDADLSPRIRGES